jgi:hypothetical protein
MEFSKRGTHMRAKRVLLLAAVVTMLLAIGGAASGSTLHIEPSGSIRAISVGKVTLARTSEGAVIACNVTMEGTVAGSSSGTLSASPEPATNPRIGSFSAGRVAECTGATTTYLYGPGKWEWYGHFTRGETWGTYWLHATYLVSSMLTPCLYDVLMTVTYNERTNQAITESSQILSKIPLLVTCPVITAEGTYRFEPALRGFLI